MDHPCFSPIGQNSFSKALPSPFDHIVLKEQIQQPFHHRLPPLLVQVDTHKMILVHPEILPPIHVIYLPNSLLHFHLLLAEDSPFLPEILDASRCFPFLHFALFMAVLHV